MIIVIGAGIAGLSLAWHLIKSGERVTVIEQGKVGRGASWAATAYLEPRPGVGKMRHLEWQSVTQWPAFAEEIAKISAMPIDYQRGSQLKVAFADTEKRFDKEQALREQGQQAFGAKYSADFELLNATQARALEPNLSEQIIKAVLLPNVHWLDGRLFCEALSRAIEIQGGIILQQTKAKKICQTDGTITGLDVETDSGTNHIPCEKLVLCAGFEGNLIEDLPSDIPKSRAIRGVAITYQMDVQNPLTKRLIKHPSGILCPRGDGRLIVGATHEEDQSEPIVTDQAVATLKASAERTMPALQDMPISESVAGIRASVGDGMLRLGRSKAVDNVYYALSQGGAGFLRAAIFGDEFSQFIIGNHDKTPHIAAFLRG